MKQISLEKNLDIQTPSELDSSTSDIMKLMFAVIDENANLKAEIDALKTKVGGV